MDTIKEFLLNNFHQSHQNKRFWTSYKNSEDIWQDGWVDMTREFANRTQCHFRIIFNRVSDDTPNLIIELFTMIDNCWMQVFWGDIRDLDDLKFILERIGIPYIKEQE